MKFSCSLIADLATCTCPLCAKSRPYTG